MVSDSGARTGPGFRDKNWSRIPGHRSRIPGPESVPDSGTHFCRNREPEYAGNAYAIKDLEPRIVSAFVPRSAFSHSDCGRAPPCARKRIAHAILVSSCTLTTHIPSAFSGRTMLFQSKLLRRVQAACESNLSSSYSSRNNALLRLASERWCRQAGLFSGPKFERFGLIFGKYFQKLEESLPSWALNEAGGRP